MKTLIVLLSVFALISTIPHRGTRVDDVHKIKEFENVLSKEITLFKNTRSFQDDGKLDLADKQKFGKRKSSVKEHADFPISDDISTLDLSKTADSTEKEVKLQKELKIVKEEKEVTKGIIKESKLVKEVKEGFQEGDGVTKRSKKVKVVKEEVTET